MCVPASPATVLVIWLHECNKLKATAPNVDVFTIIAYYTYIILYVLYIICVNTVRIITTGDNRKRCLRHGRRIFWIWKAECTWKAFHSCTCTLHCTYRRQHGGSTDSGVRGKWIGGVCCWPFGTTLGQLFRARSTGRRRWWWSAPILMHWLDLSIFDLQYYPTWSVVFIFIHSFVLSCFVVFSARRKMPWYISINAILAMKIIVISI